MSESERVVAFLKTVVTRCLSLRSIPLLCWLVDVERHRASWLLVSSSLTDLRSDKPNRVGQCLFLYCAPRHRLAVELGDKCIDDCAFSNAEDVF